MTEITDLSVTDSSNTAVTGESLNGNVANMGRMDNTLQAVMGLLARSIRTNVLRFLDSTDATKKVALDLSGITTATTRTLTVPNYSGSVYTQATGTDIASASTINLGAATGSSVTITGTTTITAFGTAAAGIQKNITFSGVLTLSYNATSLILPGTANIRTGVGDTAIAVSEGSGNWRVTNYVRANGLSISGPFVTSSSSNVTVTNAERGNAILVDASGGSRTVALPAAATAGSGFNLVIKKSDSSTNTVVIDANGSETIDGALTYTLRLQNQSVAITCSGSAWSVMSDGAILERGTNANGDYVRFANGLQICTKSMFPGVACATASGNIFWSSGFSAGSLPVNYIARPVVTATGTPGSGNGWTIVSTIASTSTWGSYRHAAPVTDASTAGVLDLTATGFWY